MNLLIISRPGVRIYHELRKSETAWYALRFYDPLETPIGIYISIGSLSAALSLASDLKYFIRKYGIDHFFEVKPGLFCTSAVAKSKYLTRDNASGKWPWKIYVQIDSNATINRYSTLPENGIIVVDGKTQGDYLIPVYCTEEEYVVFQYVF
ncbi:MAG: hypothetical protein GXY48_00355 [Methanomicrobiales archaeon]|nr:hypothetical protein [Methanomicrobiales archaeon]